MVNTDSSPEVRRPFRWHQFLLPLAIGGAVVGYVFWTEFDPEALAGIRWNVHMGVSLFLAMGALALRHLFYMMRIHALTMGSLSWRAAFEVIVLWEMALLVAPMIVGGTAAAFFLLLRERLPLGKTTSVVMAIILVDHLLFVLLGPVLWWFPGKEGLIPGDASEVFAHTLQGAFWTGWVIFAVYSALLGLGIWYRPDWIERILLGIAEIPVFRRWKSGFRKTAHDIRITAEHLQQRGLLFWGKILLLTLLGWSLRFLHTGFVIQMFQPELSLQDHVLIYARQVVMWLGMLVMPLPGGAGFAETTFNVLLSEFIPEGLSPILMVLWRVSGFYVYLLVGVVVLPLWWRRTMRGAGTPPS